MAKKKRFKISILLEGDGIYGDMPATKSSIKNMVNQDAGDWAENTDLNVKKVIVTGK